MCAQRKKWSVENFQFSETDFSRPVQRFANHWQEGSGERMLSSPRAVRQRSENTTNPSHRIMLVRATKKRSKPSDTCAKSTHPPSPTCAIERTGELVESVSAHPLVSASEGPRQLLSLLCLAELHWFCGLVFLFTQDFASCPSRLSALQAGITPTCTFFLSLDVSLFCVSWCRRERLSGLAQCVSHQGVHRFHRHVLCSETCQGTPRSTKLHSTSKKTKGQLT